MADAGWCSFSPWQQERFNWLLQANMGRLTKQTLTQILTTSMHNICKHTQTYTGVHIECAQIITHNLIPPLMVVWCDYTYTIMKHAHAHYILKHAQAHTNKTLVFEADDLCQEMTGKWCNVLIQNLFWESVLIAQMLRHNSKCTFTSPSAVKCRLRTILMTIQESTTCKLQYREIFD